MNKALNKGELILYKSEDGQKDVQLRAFRKSNYREILGSSN